MRFGLIILISTLLSVNVITQTNSNSQELLPEKYDRELSYSSFLFNLTCVLEIAETEDEQDDIKRTQILSKISPKEKEKPVFRSVPLLPSKNHISHLLNSHIDLPPPFIV